MIKIYCDKCGKEITDNVNKEIEETEAISLDGEVVAKWTKTLHYCDECQHNDLTCGFKVGDQVITDDGRVGEIIDICDCDSCKKRGFYEPRIKMTIGNGQIWITDSDKENGFIRFYKIGDRIFGNIDDEAEQRIREKIFDLRYEIAEYESQLNWLLDLTNSKLK